MTGCRNDGITAVISWIWACDQGLQDSHPATTHTSTTPLTHPPTHPSTHTQDATTNVPCCVFVGVQNIGVGCVYVQCLFLSKKCLRLRYWMASPGDASCNYSKSPKPPSKHTGQHVLSNSKGGLHSVDLTPARREVPGRSIRHFKTFRMQT